MMATNAKVEVDAPFLLVSLHRSVRASSSRPSGEVGNFPCVTRDDAVVFFLAAAHGGPIARSRLT